MRIDRKSASSPPNPIGEAPVVAPAVPASAVGRKVRHSLFSSTLLLMGATLASRALGIFREIVLANQFGTSAEYGAYKAAFRIPDTLFLLFAGGALGSSLIPVFSRFLGEQEQEKAWRLANAIVNYMLIALAVCSALAWLFAPLIVSTILAPGYPPELQELTANLTRMLLLQPFYLGLGGIIWSLLNGCEQFLWPAIAPLIYNLSVIAGALFLVGPFGIYGVAAGVLVGAFLYLVVQLPPLIRLGFYWKPGLDRDAPGIGSVLKALGPRLIGQAAFQANFFVATNLGSGLTDGPNRVAAFEYAYQLFMLPHGIFAWSVATAVFPTMSRLLGENNVPGMKQTLLTALRQVIFLVLPAALGLGLLSKPIVAALLQSGRFGSDSTDMVSHALFYFSFGLVGYGVVEILTRAYFALHDSRTPVRVALVTVALNLILSWILIKPFQQGGLALALAISTTVEMILLAWWLRRKIGPFDPDNRSALPIAIFKIVIAADAMGLALFIALQLLQDPLNSGNKLVVLTLTVGLVAFGGAIYAGAAYLLKLEELRTTLRRFLRR